MVRWCTKVRLAYLETICVVPASELADDGSVDGNDERLTGLGRRLRLLEFVLF